MTYSVGIDFGTSGARAIAIDSRRHVVAQARQTYAGSLVSADTWRLALLALIDQLPLTVRQQTEAIAINGTSSTVLLCDREGSPLGDALLYNDSRGQDLVDTVSAIAPAGSPTLSATSTLTKLLWWCGGAWRPPANAAYLMHQADWLGWLLHHQLGISDYHNALKLGYDVGALQYPDWLTELGIAPLLPRVVAPGSAIAPVAPAIAQRFQLPPTCQVCAGTTDSIAAFLASGAQQPGDGVTSLGSTLVIKLLSEVRVDDSASGVYSHRLGNLWLVGGASNTGGAVLKHYFSDQQLAALSQQINSDRPAHLDYYPLLSPGERFPINAPHLQPRLTRPSDDVQFLQGMLEGIARIEALGYQRLRALGASPLQQVYTAGGGGKNLVWQAIRQRQLGTTVQAAQQPEAAYGSALLAQSTSPG